MKPRRTVSALPRACGESASPYDLWIAFRVILPLSEGLCTLAEWLVLLPCGKSNSLPSLPLVCVSFSSDWQCFCSYNHIISLLSGSLATPLASSSKHAFSFFCNMDRLRILQIFRFAEQFLLQSICFLLHFIVRSQEDSGRTFNILLRNLL